MIIEHLDRVYLLDKNGENIIGSLSLGVWEGRKLSPVMKKKIEMNEALYGSISLAEQIFLSSLRTHSHLWRMASKV